MIRLRAVVPLTALLAFAPLGTAKALDFDELSKYLGFIEGFQYMYEFCNAEAKLPRKEIDYAREHIFERRALIFDGLTERQRDRVVRGSEEKKKKMLDAVMASLEKSQPDKPLKELCKEGFFTGVIQSETNAEEKEEKGIRAAKE